MSSLRDTLERLYDEQAQGVFQFAMVLTRSHADAEDVLQEIFCRLAKHPRLLRSARNERALLFRMARNLVVDAARRRAVREAHAENSTQELFFEPVEHPDEKAWREAVSTAMAELPEDQRAVLHLKIWEEMTFDQIAKSLRIPAGTAASRFRYAMNKLQDLLRPAYEEMRK